MTPKEYFNFAQDIIAPWANKKVLIIDLYRLPTLHIWSEYVGYILIPK